MCDKGSYSVGYTDEGDTAIYITYQGVRTRLVLNEDGVRKCINLLAATLPENTILENKETHG